MNVVRFQLFTVQPNWKLQFSYTRNRKDSLADRDRGTLLMIRMFLVNREGATIKILQLTTDTTAAHLLINLKRYISTPNSIYHSSLCYASVFLSVHNLE